MAPECLDVIFTESAWLDLQEIADYWANRGEPERGEQYARNLPEEAIRRLRNLKTAMSGRFLRKSDFPLSQELSVFKRSYRILYFHDRPRGVVEILRFWHSHRAEPFRD